MLARLLGSAGFAAVEVSSCEEALARLETEKVSLVLSETDLPNKSGLYLLRCARERHPALEVVLFTENGSPHALLEAIRHGAYGFIVRPAESAEILSNTLERALAQSRLRRQNAQLLEELGRKNRSLLRGLEMMKALNASAQRLASTTDTEDLLTALLSDATAELRARRGFLALHDRVTGELGIKVSQGIPAEISHDLAAGMPAGLTFEIARRGKPLVVPGRLPGSLTELACEVELQCLLAQPGLLAAPLCLKERVAGVVVLSGCEPGHLFSEHDLHFLIQLSHHGALALEKAGVIHQLRRSATG